MIPSQNCLDLIEARETCSLTVYNDGYGYPTVGWGHRTSLPLGTSITQEQADAWMQSDIEWASDAVNNDITVDLNQNQFDALVSFVFNVGPEAFLTSHLRQFLNAGNFARAAQQFPLWDHVNGVVSDGLVARRANELALFLTPP